MEQSSGLMPSLTLCKIGADKSRTKLHLGTFGYYLETAHMYMYGWEVLCLNWVQDSSSLQFFCSEIWNRLTNSPGVLQSTNLFT